MKELPEDRQIYISARVWEEILPKVDISPFIYALHEKIDLSRFGAGLEKFYFTFIVVPPEDEINEPYTHYAPEQKEADVAVRVPYEQMEKASEMEVIELLEKAYLQGIEELAGLAVPDFDVAEFKQAAAEVFSEDGWYVMEV